MSWVANEKLAGGRKVLAALEAGEDPARIEQQFAGDVEGFRQRRAEFLLY
jgi:hypothetical protein